MSYNQGTQTRQKQKDKIISEVWSTMSYDIRGYTPESYKGVLSAFYIESDLGASGKSTGRYRGLAQVGPNIDEEYKNIFPELQYRYSDPNRYYNFINDPGKVSQVYHYVTSEYMESNNWKQYEVLERGMELGFDPEFMRYLSWQQGKTGAADIITSISYKNPYSKVQSNRMPGDANYTGNIDAHTFYNLVHQLDSASRKAFLPYLNRSKKSIDYNLIAGGKNSAAYESLQANLLSNYINITQKKWKEASAKSEIAYNDYMNNKPVDRMMNQFTSEDTMVSNKTY